MKSCIRASIKRIFEQKCRCTSGVCTHRKRVMLYRVSCDCLKGNPAHKSFTDMLLAQMRFHGVHARIDKSEFSRLVRCAFDFFLFFPNSYEACCFDICVGTFLLGSNVIKLSLIVAANKSQSASQLDWFFFFFQLCTNNNPADSFTTTGSCIFFPYTIFLTPVLSLARLFRTSSITLPFFSNRRHLAMSRSFHSLFFNRNFRLCEYQCDFFNIWP